MGLFVFISAALVLVALAFATHSLRKSNKKLAIAIALALPLLTFALYRGLGNTQAFDVEAISQSTAGTDINSAITNLQRELQSNPGNLEGWVLLARTHMAMQDYENANQAFAKAISLAPDDPDLKAERAEAMMRASDSRSFPAEAVTLLEEALSKEPGHERAMFFLGMHYLQQGDSARAEVYLNKLLPKLDPEAATALREQINIARARQNKPPLEVADTEPVDARNVKIKVSVTLDNSLASSVNPGAVLFVFAKSTNDAGPPVAAKRMEVGKFPVQLELSDSDSLMPTANLSSQEKVAISARISRQGMAIAQPGDIEADAVIVETKSANTVEIKLSRVKQ